MVLALLGALAALSLRAAEEVRELGIPVPLGVLDVGLESQRVREALLCEPDDVVVLVLVPVTSPVSDVAMTAPFGMVRSGAGLPLRIRPKKPG
jgi:hypothetical protein